MLSSNTFLDDMLLKGLYIVLVLIVSLLLAMIPILSRKTDSLFRTLVISGITLICSAFPGGADKIIGLIASWFNLAPYVEPQTDYVQLFIGILILVIAFIHRYTIQNKLYILNMQGSVRHFVTCDKYLKDLNVADHQAREIIIDTGWAQENFRSMNKSQWKSLKTQIEDTLTAFCNKDYKKSFTGMAPIPITIYAGTCYKNQEITSFLEYNNSTDSYVELRKSKNYPNLTCFTQESTKSDEIVVAISITAQISGSDLAQFNYPIVSITCPNCNDNTITSSLQLQSYVDTIADQLEALSKQGIKRIHLLCAIQSSLAFALGQRFAHMQNRLTEIVSYHYVKSENPCYVKGIVVSGVNKGKIYID